MTPVCCCVQLLESYPTLFDPVDCSPPDSSVHGILQTRILEWVAILFSRDLPDPGMEPGSPALQGDSLLSEPPGKHIVCVCVCVCVCVYIYILICTSNLNI